MDKYRIRPAEKNDSRLIRRLIDHVQINPLGLDWRHFLVAITAGGEFAGCGQIKPHRDGSRELASIAVWEKYRGQGIARGIIERLLEVEQARPLFLMCRSRLIPFYSQFGFEDATSSELPPYFKRIKRLESVFNHAADANDRLAIMRLD